MLHYTIHKNEKSTQWVTFIHGAGGSSTIWYKQLKVFQNNFNVLLIDLRGHGNSKNSHPSDFKSKYNFTLLSNDILEVLHYLKIEKSHFVGISLGTILIRQLAENHPTFVQSMLLGGAILKMNFRSQILMKLGTTFKYLLPYMILYKLFAFVILPRKSHKQSRTLFINEAKKLDQKEFIRWFKLTSGVNPILKKFRNIQLRIPTLYIMGEEDYMFLPNIKKMVLQNSNFSKLIIIPECGHIVNVQDASVFNTESILFIKEHL